MNLKEYRTYLHKKLDSIYGKEEVDSFFFMILEHYLGINKISFFLKPIKLLNSTELEELESVSQRLITHEPIQYILGETEFYGLNFKLNNSVLVPRPETEELVDWIIKDNNSKNKLAIIDVGTGSGCIAISLAKHLPNSRVTAVDLSKGALQIARKNAILNNLEIDFSHLDILDKHSLNEFKGKGFDIIVSNPPYVRYSEKHRMKDNVVKYEPEMALFVEDDNPLIFYKKIALLANSLLILNGYLYFEINEYLSEELASLLENLDFKEIEIRNDINGKPRMIKSRKS